MKECESDFEETTGPSDQIKLFEGQINRIQELIDHPDRFIDRMASSNYKTSFNSAELIEAFQKMMDDRKGLTVSLKD